MAHACIAKPPPPLSLCEPVSLYLFKRRLRGTTYYPGGPCGSSTPCMPCTPCTSCIRRTPCKPGGLCGPLGPAGPTAPAAPAAPADELLAGWVVQGCHFPLAPTVAKLLLLSPVAPAAPVLLLARVVRHSHVNPADPVDLVDSATLAVPDVRSSDYFSVVTFTGEIVRYRK
jgi:hypothetical protein